MLILSAIISLCGMISNIMKLDEAISVFVDGAAQMTNMFLVFIFFEAMFTMINLGNSAAGCHTNYRFFVPDRQHGRTVGDCKNK